MRHTGQPERGVQVKRVLEIVVWMSSRSVSFYDIAERFNVSIKTARRDLELIESVGIPVYDVEEAPRRGVVKRFRVDSHFARRIL